MTYSILAAHQWFHEDQAGPLTASPYSDIFLLCSPLNFCSSVIFISLSTSFDAEANKNFQKLCFLMPLVALSVVNMQWTWCHWHIVLKIFIPCLWSQEQLDICWGLAQQTCLPALTPYLGTAILCSSWLENPWRSQDLFPISCGSLQTKVLSRQGMAHSMFSALILPSRDWLKKRGETFKGSRSSTFAERVCRVCREMAILRHALLSHPLFFQSLLLS